MRIYYGIRYSVPKYINKHPLGKRGDKYWNKRNEKVLQGILKLQKRPVYKGGLLGFDPYLGWDTVPGTHRGQHTTYKINSQRIRADREYTLRPGPGIKRVIVVGDSFTFGEDAENEDCWVGRLNHKLGDKVEILNMAVPGYGTDQAFLKWMRSGLKFNANVAVLGIYLENIFRNVNIFRSFYISEGQELHSKPRFILNEKGKLNLINLPVVPLEKLWQTISRFSDSPLRKYEYFYERYFLDQGIWGNFYLSRYISKRIKDWRRTYEYGMKPGSEPYEITVAIADAFRKVALMNNIDPYIIIIPLKEHLFKYENNFFWQDFLDELTRRRIKYLDLTPGLFKEAKLKHLRPKDLYLGHFTNTANKIAAEIVYRYLINEKAFETKTYH